MRLSRLQLLVVLAVSAVYLALIGALPMVTQAHGLHDDALYAALALALLTGDWLGSYTSLTLAKGPF